MIRMIMMEMEPHTKICYNMGAKIAPFILPENSLFKLTIYYVANAWCFDDDKRGLITEPFVLGSSEMMDEVIKSTGQELDRTKKYDITFSRNPFPEYDASFSRLTKEYDGYWYKMDGCDMKGWLCPATTLYFGDHPYKIYLSVSLVTD